MTPKESDIQGSNSLFAGHLVPVLYLRLVESLSVEHQGNPTAIERALHNLGKTMTTPLLLGLIKDYGQPPEAFYPTQGELFLNRIDEYIAKNWKFATGYPPESLEFTDDRTLLLKTSACPICRFDTFEANLDLRYCEIVSGMLEGLFQHWIDNLKLAYQARVTQIAGRLQGDPSCDFRIHFSDKSLEG